MKINNKNFFIILCAIFMIRPYYVQLCKTINLIWAVMTLILSVLCCIRTQKYESVKKDKFFYIFICTYLIATLINCEKNIMSAISNSAQITLAYSLGRLFENNRYKQKIIRYTPMIFSIYIYLDFMSILFDFSKKIWNIESSISFLGYDNYAAFYIVPIIGIKFSLDYMKKNRLNWEDWTFYFCCLFSKVLTKSYTATFAIILIPVFAFMIMHARLIRKLFNVKGFAVLILLLFDGIYFFNIQNVFSHLLSMAGKGITLNSRTVIWKFVLSHIFNVPIYGLGNITDDYFMTFFDFPYGYIATHAHFLYLDLIIQTGVIGSIAYLGMLFSIRLKKVYLRKEVLIYPFVCLLSFLVLSMFDAYLFVATPYFLIGYLTSLTWKLERENYVVQDKNSCKISYIL